MKRVVVTGMAGISPLGHDWATVQAHLHARHNVVQVMPGWEKIDGLLSRLGAPAASFELPSHYNRKTTRSMGRIAMMSTRATELALQDAGLLDDPLLRSGRMGVSYGSSMGSSAAIGDFGHMLLHQTTDGITANTYIKMMPHTTAANIAVFFGLTGRMITTSSACTSGSQGIGYAYETIREGRQIAMVAGGAEELEAIDTAVFDTLFATSTQNATPELTPRPFDAHRDGLVLGEGAGTLILEEYEHARARGAHIHAEIVGFGTNCDGTHITQPNAKTMAIAMQLALEDAGLQPADIGYINAHGTATEHGDIAESAATLAVFGDKVPIATLKSYMGHTLGACGALEAWMSIEMQREGWFAPNLNLTERDPRCAPIGYITGDGLALDCEFIVSNNFAFGGVNTALVIRRWPN